MGGTGGQLGKEVEDRRLHGPLLVPSGKERKGAP
jgi:hypothetical protein